MLSSEAIRHIVIVTYSANILLGIISLTFYGITIATNPYLTVGESFTFKGGGLIKIFSSLANITIGILGIVGVVQNWRILLKIIVCILACAVVTNVVILVMHLTNRNTLTKSDINEYREKLTKQYGEDEGVTSFLNNGQEEELCCGWSGDEKENLFLQSPWYKLVNANVTGKKTTLPDSCCLEPGPKCQQAENLKEAREKKYVHKYDCLTKISNKDAFYDLMISLWAVFTSLCQAMCVASTMVSIMGPAE
uniref:Tetraspanin n=1 Tax=Macrostomum lignano TaxID=282301 RepID=A0A1I8GQU0_9PLAT